MSVFQKIPGPFLRDPETNKLTEEWSSPELSVTADLADWFFTEKIDGTNVRVYWDGYRASYRGRTDSATFSGRDSTALEYLFKTDEFENLLEQKFGTAEVVLYGELYGPGIQGGGKYTDTISFALFDVYIAGFWLSRANVEDVAQSLGLDAVPLVWADDLSDLHDGINIVRAGLISSSSNNPDVSFYAEGLVARLHSGLLNRKGERIIVKLKHRDLFNG